MKILSVALSGPYNDDSGYQGCLLPKWQKLNGNEVVIVASCLVTNKNNADFSLTKHGEYYNTNNIKVIRLPFRKPILINKILRRYIGFKEVLKNERPDFVFIHGCQFLESLIICKYLKNNRNVKAVVDNHADTTNSMLNFPAKILHKTLWKYCAHKLNRYVEIFYGVSPIRMDFLNKAYGIPNDRIHLLLMGADDEDIKTGKEKVVFKSIENKRLNVVCCGKFDEYKKEVINVMEAAHMNKDINLNIFGSVGDVIKNQFNNLLYDNVKYLGWQNQIDSYATIMSNDIAIFPGRHSVMWEQCVAMGIPLIVKRIPGTDHVDIGGNCIFLENSSTQEILSIFNKLTDDDQMLSQMIKNAQSVRKNDFLYSAIAKKSVEMYK